MNAIDILGDLLGTDSPIRTTGRGGSLEDLVRGDARQSRPDDEDSGGMSLGKKAVIGILGGVVVAALLKKMRNRGESPQTEAGGAGIEMPSFEDLQGTEAQANERAELLIKAMLNAAKADGRVDAQEEQKIIARLENLDDEGREFLRRELRAGVDVAGLARSVPAGMQSEVYAMSLVGIELDDHKEAQYLLDLATALGLTGAECNRIHRELGAPEIFN